MWNNDKAMFLGVPSYILQTTESKVDNILDVYNIMIYTYLATFFYSCFFHKFHISGSLNESFRTVSAGGTLAFFWKSTRYESILRKRLIFLNWTLPRLFWVM